MSCSSENGNALPADGRAIVFCVENVSIIDEFGQRDQVCCDIGTVKNVFQKLIISFSFDFHLESIGNSDS